MADKLRGAFRSGLQVGAIHGSGQSGLLLDSVKGVMYAPAGLDCEGDSLPAGSPTVCPVFPAGTLNRQVGVVGNGADATDDVLYTYTLPAKVLSRVGQAIRIRILGKLAANGNNKSVKVNFGGTTFTMLNAIGANNSAFELNVTIIRTGPSTQLANWMIEFSSVDTTGLPAGLTSTQVGAAAIAMTEVDTGALVINVTGKSGSSTASDVTVNDFKVDLEQF